MQVHIALLLMNTAAVYIRVYVVFGVYSNASKDEHQRIDAVVTSLHARMKSSSCEHTRSLYGKCSISYCT
jgi:hypothetical protein